MREKHVKVSSDTQFKMSLGFVIYIAKIDTFESAQVCNYERNTCMHIKISGFFSPNNLLQAKSHPVCLIFTQHGQQSRNVRSACR